MQPPKPEEKKPIDHIDEHHVPNKNLRPYLIGSVIILIIALFLLGLFPRLALWKEITKTAEEKILPSVVVINAKSEKKPISLVLPSSTYAMRTTPIWARVDGYLENFFVDIGDRVEENQLLAVIDTPEIDKQVLQAKADLLRAQAQLEIAAISAHRWEELYHRNAEAVPKQEVDERAATLSSSQANVEAFQANLQRLEKLQAFKDIIAPFRGIITERDIDIGSLITSGSAGTNPLQLFVIQKIDVLRVFVNVPQYFFRLIKDGGTADVTIQEFPGKVFKGTIARTSGALDPIARTLLTEVHIDNKDYMLTTGLYAEVTFSLIPDEEYFIIPTNAVIIRSGDPKVAILDENDVAKIVPVTLGRDFGKTIEITSGLHENDRVVIDPNENVKTGTKVRVLKKDDLPL